MKMPWTPSSNYLSSETAETLKAQYMMGEINEADYRWLMGEGEDDADSYRKKSRRRFAGSYQPTYRPRQNY